MSRDQCAREAEVLAAVESGAWDDTLRAHVAACAECRDVQVVAEALTAAALAEVDEPLPDAGRLWWRAQLDARREARRRSMRALDTVDRAEPFIAVAVAFVLIALRGDHFMEVLTRLLPGGTTGVAVEAVLPAPVMAILVGGLLLTGLMLLVGLGAALARD